MLMLAATLVGCYTAVPIAGTAVPAGNIVVLTINDAGRLAYGEQLGASIDRIEGRVVQHDSTGYTLAMRQVELLRGGTQVWSGERVRIKTEHIVAASERRLAKGRTAALSAAAVGAVVMIARVSLAGVIGGDDAKAPTDSFRSVRFPRF